MPLCFSDICLVASDISRSNMTAESAIGKGFRFRVGKRGSQIYDSARRVRSQLGRNVKLTQHINTETGWTETTRTVSPATEITRVK